MISATIFVLFNCASYVLAFMRGPQWALIAYMNIYFNPPNVMINWWAGMIPFDRWSLLTTAILIVTAVIHKDKLSKHPLANVKWGFVFYLLSAIIYLTRETFNDTGRHLYMLFTYCLIMYLMVRSLKDVEHLKLILFFIVIFTGVLSLDAYLDGSRDNARLEGTGSADAFGSNEFALLLCGTMPFILVFLKNGLKYQKLVALAAAPFVLNAFILCNSRGAMVALVGGVFIALVLVADNKIRKQIIALGIIAFPVFIYLTDAEFIERIATLVGYQEAMQNEQQADTLSSGRTEIWRYGLEMVKDNPTGVGPNGFKKIARFYMPEHILTFKPGNPHGERSAHSTYIQVLVEQGTAGFIIWLSMCIHTGFLLVRAFRLSSNLKVPNPFLRDTTFASGVAYFSILLGGVFNSRIYYEYFWWQIALIAVQYAIVRQTHQDGQEQETDKSSMQPTYANNDNPR